MDIIYDENLPPIKKYFELFETTGWNESFKLLPDEIDKAVRKSWYTISAYQNNELIGFGRIVSDGVMHAMIYEMIVRPDFQRKGIGAQILLKLLDKCKSHKIRDIHLFCAKGKRAFYEKYDFTARPDDAPGMQYKRNYY